MPDGRAPVPVSARIGRVRAARVVAAARDGLVRGDYIDLGLLALHVAHCGRSVIVQVCSSKPSPKQSVAAFSNFADNPVLGSAPASKLASC